jgi:membrane protease YdiL (CAAX protease family)/LysM repeat protein
LLLALALAPLIRILSISLPLQNLPLIDWYLIIGALLYLAVFFAARITGISGQRMGITAKGWPLQLAIGPIGFGLGLMEFMILGSRPLIENPNWPMLIYASFVLMVFTGFLEEIIFRGLIQDVSTATMGRFGIWYCAVLFAVLHIGYLSVPDILFVFGVGLLFGYISHRTRSLLGVSLAHGFTNISMYLIYPFIAIGGLFSSQPSLQPRELLILPATQIAPLQQQTPPLVFFVTPTPNSLAAQATLTPLIASETVPVATSTAAPSPTPVQSPAATSVCSVPQGWVLYMVRSGDTLYALSLIFRITLAQLQNANCLTTTVIRPGQSLYVPFVLPTNTLAPTSATPYPSSTPLSASNTPSNTPLSQADTDTPVPAASDTSVPIPSDTPPSATDTPVPVPTNTAVPIPTDTSPPAPTVTSAA